MKIYIASHNQKEAQELAERLTKAGHIITSTWINESFKRTHEYNPADRISIANKDVDEVRKSDALVLISGQDWCPGGKFVEAGVAIGLGIPVLALGHLENMLLWHYRVIAVKDIDGLLAKLDSIPPMFGINAPILSPGGMKWLIWSHEHTAWWRPNAQGYCCERKNAGEYGFDQACEILHNANFGLKGSPNEAIVPVWSKPVPKI